MLTLPKITFIGILIDHYFASEQGPFTLDGLYQWLLETQNVTGSALDPNLHFDSEKDRTLFLLRWKR